MDEQVLERALEWKCRQCHHTALPCILMLDAEVIEDLQSVQDGNSHFDRRNDLRGARATGRHILEPCS